MSGETHQRHSPPLAFQYGRKAKTHCKLEKASADSSLERKFAEEKFYTSGLRATLMHSMGIRLSRHLLGDPCDVCMLFSEA